jgi:DNA-binding NarL/FixJ family response regulator
MEGSGQIPTPEGNVERTTSTSAPRIGVVVVDDHCMVAEALAEIIGAEVDLEVLGTAGSVAAGIAIVERTRPDVVLMDYCLPGGNGGSATREIKARWPATAVIMLTGAGGHQVLGEAIDAGCTGFLVKELRGPVLVDAIRSVYQGEVVIHAKALAEVLRHEPTSSHGLTRRELEILELLANGSSTDEIARTLYVSPHTVRNHVSNILAKLGTHSKLEAVSVARRTHIVDVSAEPPPVHGRPTVP